MEKTALTSCLMRMVSLWQMRMESSKQSEEMNVGRLETQTEEGELSYEDEDGDEAYGFGFLDFAHGEDDELTRMEIGQRVRDKLAKREYLDQRKTMQNISFENGVFIDQISVAKQDSKEEYNIELSTNEVEVETE